MNGSVNTMNWLNTMSGNFATHMKNFVASSPLYGILVNGALFTLYPECNSVAAGGSLGGIQVTCYDVENVSINSLQQKWYKAPVPGYPAYIEELNCVLFSSEEERAERIKAYGNSSTKLVKAHASGMAAIINATYTAVTVLNTDEQFYMLNNGSITRLPAANDDQKDETIKKYNLDPQVLDVSYVFVLNTVVRNTRASEGDHNEVTVTSDIKIVSKNTVSKGEPLIQDNSGFVIFNGRDSADAFISKYGTLTKYLVTKAITATKAQYEADLQDVNDQAAEDKNAMMNVYLALGGTSMISILSENLIKSFNESDNDGDAVKKALKVFGIGLGAIATGIGLFKLAKHLNAFDKKRKDKNQNK